MIPAAKAAREAFYVNDKGSPGLEVACIVLCSSLLLVSGESLGCMRIRLSSQALLH